MSNPIVLMITSYFVFGGLLLQTPMQSLLEEVCRGSSAVAERELESEGIKDLAVRQTLSDRLPSLLSQIKEVKSLVLLAKLSGALKLESTVPALSNLLQDDRNKSMSTTLYQTEELIDDPVGAALVHIGEPSVSNVSVLLQSPDAQIRSRAVRVLAKIGTPDALDALRHASDGETNAWIRALMLKGAQGKSSVAPSKQ